MNRPLNATRLNETICQTGLSGDLHARLWLPDAMPVRGCVIIVHGLGEHGQRYRDVAAHLAEQGWASFAADLIGHGHSPGRRGHIPSYHKLMQDIHAMRRTASECLGNLGHAAATPQVVLGHSMGGNLAVNYALRRHEFDQSLEDCAGLILSAPMLLPTNAPSRHQIFAAWLTGFLIPWFTVRAPVDTSKLTRNPDTVSKLRDDPLMHGRISVYLATQLLAQGRYALDNAGQIDLPTMVMHGEEDPITSYRASESFALRAGDHVHFASFPDMLHEIFHETEATIVFETLTRWLDDLVAPKLHRHEPES
jgi:alpha-beta hydrolase superfamily lysophospholipase